MSLFIFLVLISDCIPWSALYPINWETVTKFNLHKVNISLQDWDKPHWYDLLAGVPGLTMASIYKTIEVLDSNNGVFLFSPPPKVIENDKVDSSSKGKASSSTICVTWNSNNSKPITLYLIFTNFLLQLALLLFYGPINGSLKTCWKLLT